ncbi:hypothetical protein [Porphyromonas loveana]|uniref:hypothetical protein n=1 Tax=Porphyromonas loveana TaxID=1884669 RepID=UPI0035A016C1
MDRRYKTDECFYAAYFVQKDKLRSLIATYENLLIRIQVWEKDARKYFWPTYYIEVSVIDLLSWVTHSLYRYATGEEEGMRRKYYDAVECLEVLCDKFEINNYKLVDYSTFRPLRHVLSEEDEYLDDDQIAQYISEGFRKIDLDLINYAERGNAPACWMLIKESANPNIDPIDGLERGVAIDIVDYLSSLYCFFLDNFVQKGIYPNMGCVDMLADLYKTAMTDYIGDILKYKA